MDIKHFRYFIAVAEALNFTRAAHNLNIAQQPLSRRIAELERDLGVRLFARNSKTVKLTEVGEAFLPKARDIVQAFDAAVHGVRVLSPSQSRHLRIALSPEHSLNVLTDIITRLQQERIKVHLIDASISERQRLLAAGEIDIGVLQYPFEIRGLRMSAPLALPLGVIMSIEHPLAKVAKLHLPDLTPYPLVQFQRHMAPGLYDELQDLCRIGGYVPRRVLHSLRLTPAGFKTESAVALAPERSFARSAEAESKDFIWRPLEGSPIHKWISVACRSNEWVGILRVAVDVIFASLQQHDGWAPMPRPPHYQEACET